MVEIETHCNGESSQVNQQLTLKKIWKPNETFKGYQKYMFKE